MGQENRDKVLSLVTETRPSQPNKSVRRIVSIQGIVIYVQPTHTIRRVVQTLTRSEPIWRLGNLSLRAPRIVDHKAELQMLQMRL
ncbi:hypothetical protein SAMN03159511_2405 [Pseudomonas sp. NFACC19-2]|nr:hypothetical protein SAMN03159511_2405 [Pseudomonas sp. NFACC19-2]